MCAWQTNPIRSSASVASASTDPMDWTVREISERAMENAFSRLKPKPEYIDTFLPWQELFRQKRTQFIMTMPIHQSDGDPTLHISVVYQTTFTNWLSKFHIYGTLNKSFYVYKITQQKQDGTIMTIAEF